MSVCERENRKGWEKFGLAGEESPEMFVERVAQTISGSL